MKHSPKQLLVLLLRFVGGVCVVAIVPMFMPHSWIIVIHEAMGLGVFPEQPIADYLVRSTSALCLFYGGLLLVLSFDVCRFARVITYQALAIMVVSACGAFLGASAGIPIIWVAADAIACWIYCLPTLWLQWKIAASDHRTNDSN